MTEHERTSMTLIAAAELSRRVFQIRDNWAESSPEKQNELWRSVHDANMQYHRVTNHPGDFTLVLEENRK